MMERLIRFRDEAWAADFVGRLSPRSLYAWIGRYVRVCLDGEDPEWLDEQMAECYGERVGPDAKETERIEDLIAREEGGREIYGKKEGEGPEGP